MTKVEGRTLWVGAGISWDAQWARAVKLYGDGITVTIHDHGQSDRCRKEGARCKCGVLISGEDGATLDLFGSDGS